MKRILCSMLMALMAFAAVKAVTPTAGKVYKLENVAYSGYYLDANGFGDAVMVKRPSNGSRAQLWYCESSGVLRSLSNGYYLSSPDAINTAWTTAASVSNNTRFTFTETSGRTVIRRSNLSGTQRYLHADAYHKAVCWSSDADASKWIITEVSMTSSEISSILSQITSVNSLIGNASTYQTALNNLFSDKACTQLKVSNATSSSYYSQLSPALKTMVSKVQNNNWAESDGSWDATHAKRFRVQEFKPYSRGAECSVMLGGTFPFTNMNNPTGIITVDSDILYVMVDSEPATGSSLYIKAVSDEGLYNDYAAGTQLHAGLNLIPSHGDCYTYYIYYTVDTYNTTSKTKQYSLANFKPIKIHFEGGKVNGFFELDKDTNADWEYYRERARHLMFDFVSKSVNLHLHFDQTQTGSDYSETAAGCKTILHNIDVSMVMRQWELMCLRERLLIGIQSPSDVYSSDAQSLFSPLSDTDYYNYVNNRIMACTGTGAIYMNSGNWRTQYNTNTMSGILTGMLWGGDGMWGPAHEFGHAMQEPMNFAGTSEVSNNIFSNVAVYCHGKYTSRAEYPSTHRQSFLNGVKFLDRVAFDETRMFWQLFVYYHILGHNKQFYPRLQELLRRDPLQHPASPSITNERYDMLHFAKKCCIAAGEDLTEFFTTWGFFIPFSETRTDYTTFQLQLTQADINTVKSEIAAMGYKKNTAIIFVDDRPGSARTSYPGFNKLLCGEFGGLEAFSNPQASNAGYYLEGTTITISGNPGAGVAIYDTAGNLLDFSNSRTFTISADLAAKIKAGTAVVKAVTGNNVVTTMPTTENPQTVYNNIETMLRLVDDTESIVGMYSGSATYDLRRAYENKNLSLAQLKALYESVVNDPASTIQLRPGKPHHLVSRAYPTLSLGLDASKQLKAVATDNESMEQTWTPIDLGNGRYALRNNAESKYVGAVSRSTIVTLTATEMPFTIERGGNDDNYVYMALNYNGNATTALHAADTRNYNVVGWDSSAEPSQWLIRYVGDEMDDTGVAELREWVEKTNELLDRVGSVNLIDEAVALEPSMLESNAKSTSGIYAFTSWNVLLDNDFSTMFVTDRYNNSTDGLDHYLQVDMGADAQVRSFGFSYGTRNTSSSSFAPKQMSVYSSADGEEWHRITDLSDLPAIYPTTYESEILTSPVPARYFRFMVTNTYSSLQSNGHYYFGMSEFGMRTTSTELLINYTDYPYVTDDIFTDAYNSSSSGNALLEGRSTPLQRLQAIDDIKEKYAILLDAINRSLMSDITEIEAEPFDASAPYFDLYGRRVSNPAPGRIYIHQGRKILLQ